MTSEAIFELRHDIHREVEDLPPACQPQSAHVFSTCPLPSSTRTIRLLDIHPVAPTDRYDAPLVADIRVACLQDSPSFNALSYIWGPPAPDFSILCSFPGGLRANIPITPNCHAALVHLRQLFSPLTIWVDAICINQGDDEEKASQITLMKEIYTWARTVYIWLGSGNDQTSAGIDYIRLRARAFEPWDLSMLVNGNAEGMAREITRARRSRLVEIGYRIRHCFGILGIGWPYFYKPRFLFRYPSFKMLSLLDNEWMRRSWTFQEIILATNPVIVCGTDTLTWEDLLRALDASQEYEELQSYVASRPSSFRVLKYVPGYKFVSKLFNSAILGGQMEVANTASFEGDLKSYQRSVLLTWSSLIYLWLNLPRPCKWNGKQIISTVSPEEESFTFQERFQNAHLYNPLKSTWKVNRAIFIIVGVPTTLAVQSYLTYLVMVSLQHSRPIGLENYSNTGEKSGTVVIWLFVILYWLLTLVWLSVASVIFLLSLFMLMFGIRRVGSYQKNLDQLYGIIVALRERQSTREQDKVFGLFGILQALGASPSPPDYSRPYYRTAQIFLRDLLHWKGDAVLLLCQAGGRAYDSGPSWIPNFSPGAPQSWLTKRYGADNEGNNGATPVSSTTSFRIYEDKDELDVQGLPKGQVTFVAQLTTGPTDSPTRFNASLGAICRWIYLIESADAACQSLDFTDFLAFSVLRGLTSHTLQKLGRVRASQYSRLGPGPDLERMFSRPNDSLTLWTGDLATSVYKELGDHCREFITFLEVYDMIVSSFGTINDGDILNAAHSDFAPLADQLHQDEQHFDLLVKIIDDVVNDRRCLFVFAGGIAGSGPFDLQVEDQVFLIQGVPTPMMLRRNMGHESMSGSKDSKYTVVGAALIHGFMHEEAYDEDMLESLRLV